MLGKREFKIVKKEYVESRDCIMIVLDGTLIYKNGTGIFINVPNSRPFNTYQVGDCLEINLDRTKYEENKYDICSDTSIVRKITPTNVITASGSSSDIIISSSAVNAMKSPEVREIARELSRMVDETGNNWEYKIEIENKGGKKISHSLICRKN